MTGDEITLVRDARPDVPAFDDAAKSRVRTRLMEAAAAGPAPAPRRSRWLTAPRMLIAVSALGAAAVAGVTVVHDTGSPGRPGPGESTEAAMRPVAGIVNLAAGAARRAKAAPGDGARPDQWYYVKTVLASSSKGVGGRLFGPPDLRVTTEQWVRGDGKRSATMSGGRLEFTDLRGSKQPAPLIDRSLPADAGALLARIYRDGGWPRQHRDRWAFETIQGYLRDTVLSDETRAAMYGALAELRGVRYDARAADIAGRPGATVYQVIDGYLRQEIIVDPRTYEYLGFRYVAVRDHRTDEGDVIARGHVLGWGGTVRSGIVDEAGRRP